MDLCWQPGGITTTELIVAMVTVAKADNHASFIICAYFRTISKFTFNFFYVSQLNKPSWTVQSDTSGTVPVRHLAAVLSRFFNQLIHILKSKNKSAIQKQYCHQPRMFCMEKRQGKHANEAYCAGMRSPNYPNKDDKRWRLSSRSIQILNKTLQNIDGNI